MLITSLILLVSLRLAYDANRYLKRNFIDIERDQDGNIKINAPQAGFFSRMRQKILVILNHLRKTKEKTLIIKRQKKKEILKKETAELEIPSKIDSISYISHLLNKYQEFVKKDLTLMIQEANSFLRSLRQKIINSSNDDFNKFNNDFIEITKIYNDSEVMINQFIGKCSGYKQVILDQKQQNPQHRVVQSQLEKVIKQLEKGHRMVDLTNNNDYNFLDSYLKENKQNRLYRS